MNSVTVRSGKLSLSSRLALTRSSSISPPLHMVLAISATPDAPNVSAAFTAPRANDANTQKTLAASSSSVKAPAAASQAAR